MIAKEENRELFGPGGCLTREAIALHIDGKLTDAEAKKVMRHAKHCDLCAGALEGALMLDSGMHFNRAVSRLDNSPWRKSLTSQSHNKRLFYGFSSIAASVIILIGVFYITKMRDRLTGYPGYVSGEIVVVDDFEVVDSVPDNVLMIREPLSENNSAAKKTQKNNRTQIVKEPVVVEELHVVEDHVLQLDEVDLAFEQEEPEMAMDKIEEVHTTLKPSTEKSVKAPVLTVKRTMAAREDIEMAGYSEDVPKKGKADRKMAKKNYIVAEIMPMFRGGGVDEFSTYLGDSLKVILPDSVLRESIVVSFRVRSNGKIDKVKLIGKTSSKELNDEVVRLVEESPMWMPGMLNGTPIDVDQQLELVFNK